MRVILEIRSGPSAGKKAWLRSGQRLVVGRTDDSDCAIPHDGQISSRHFELQCDSQVCRIQDLDSSNGTFVSGQKISAGVVRSGDQILAGQTTFLVQIEQAAPLAAVTTPLQTASVEGAALAAAPPMKAVLAAPSVSRSSGIPQPYEAGLADADPLVQREALFAAAWSRQRWLLDYCRKLAQAPSAENWDAVNLLAILGQPADLPLILAIGKQPGLGAKRFEVLGTFGHPGVMDVLLWSISSRDPLEAIAAGEAFTKITGFEIDSSKPAPLPPDQPPEADDESEGEAADVALPGAERAKSHWQEVRERFSRGTRWRRGLDIGGSPSDEVLEELDLESRREACLRAKYFGTWHGTPADLESFPQIQK